MELEQIEESMISSSKLFLESFIRSNLKVQEVNEMLNDGVLKKDFLDEIFRFVYQLMFIQLGEEQGVFPRKTCSDEARKEYIQSLSLTHIEDDNNEPKQPFIERIRTIIIGLSEGSDEFGLEPLHSNLFSPDATPLLNQLKISNEDFFSGYSEILISKLFPEKIPTDEKAAMLGTIFQSLLNFQNFDFETEGLSVAIIHANGRNRKSTGSFYTPHNLVTSLVDDTLRPLIERIYVLAQQRFPSNSQQKSFYQRSNVRIFPQDRRQRNLVRRKPKMHLYRRLQRLQRTYYVRKTVLNVNHEDASQLRDEFIQSKILELKICEPSCGSGHFLFGTLDYLSSELASLGIHSDSDKKEFYWKVITNCLYGIDIFADVLEICKFVLWLKGTESAPKEAEFTFKEIHLKHGNSLLSQFIASSGMVSNHANTSPENRKTNMTLRKADSEYRRITGDIDKTQRNIANAKKNSQTSDKAFEILSYTQPNTDPGVMKKHYNAEIRLKHEKMRFERQLNLTNDLLTRFDFKQNMKFLISKSHSNRTLQNRWIHFYSEYFDAISSIWWWEESSKKFQHPLTTSDLGNYFSWLLGVHDLLEEYERIPVGAKVAFDSTKTKRFTFIRETSHRIRNEHNFFHWEVQFPEVFCSGSAGFHALIGNPPFLGGQKISSEIGEIFLTNIKVMIGSSVPGSADLCAYFFLQGFNVLRQNGILGFVSTNTISEGDTRDVGLTQIVEKGGIIRTARRNLSWDGDADVVVSTVSIQKEGEVESCILDGEEVQEITPFLQEPGKVSGEPIRLKVNSNKAFQGSIILSNGFKITKALAKEIIDSDAKYSSVIKPFIDGDDINSQPKHASTESVIDYASMENEEAKQFPLTWEIVESKVKPERQEKKPSNSTAQKRYDYYWQFGSKAEYLYRAIQPLSRVLALTLHSNVVLPAWVDSKAVFTHACGIFAYEEDFYFGLFSSQLHWWWAEKYSSSIGHGIRYTLQDVFQTYPQVVPSDTIAHIAKVLNKERAKILVKRDIGLVKLYPLVHDSEIKDKDICALRELHRQLDEAVLDAYGWSDVELGYGFHETSMGMRWTISTDARAEVLDRLLELNNNMFEQEVGQGLWR